MSKFSHGGFPGTPGGNSGRTFTDNLPDLVKEFPLDHGHFGKPSDKTNSIARIIESPDPIATAERFFRLAAEGGTMRTDKPNIKVAELKDGSFITFRVVSSSDGTPAVDLNLTPPTYVKTRKIHFTKEK
jgi:hypothetical protein